jgi:adenine-specific DNA-methyltransferase
MAKTNGQYSGRLELTWTNKALRLLADAEGGYQWVEPSDYRVAEVRLLHDVEKIGETHANRSRAKDNLLLEGDALHALTSLCELPEFAREYVGKVKLAYPTRLSTRSRRSSTTTTRSSTPSR